MPNPQSTQRNPACPRCNSRFTIKKGRRLNRFRNLQVFQCREYGKDCPIKGEAGATVSLKKVSDNIIVETLAVGGDAAVGEGAT
jgi:hypothetical protein